MSSKLKAVAKAVVAIKEVAPSIPHEEAVALAPVLINANNIEPWYYSKVTWGAIGAVIGGTSSIINEIYNGTWDMTVIQTSGLAVIGGITTLYGRWKAKPIAS